MTLPYHQETFHGGPGADRLRFSAKSALIDNQLVQSDAITLDPLLERQITDVAIMKLQGESTEVQDQELRRALSYHAIFPGVEAVLRDELHGAIDHLVSPAVQEAIQLGAIGAKTELMRVALENVQLKANAEATELQLHKHKAAIAGLISLIHRNLPSELVATAEEMITAQGIALPRNLEDLGDIPSTGPIPHQEIKEVKPEANQAPVERVLGETAITQSIELS